VIIACEKCSTRFQLDESRVPPTGAKVRCSRCRHAFVVRPAQVEAGSDADAAQRLARDAVRRTARPRTRASEERTQALGPQVPGDRAQRAERAAQEPATLGGDGDEESDWQFAEDPEPSASESDDRVVRAHRPEPPAGAEPDPVGELFATPAAEAAPAETLSELGSPEDWNLLAGGEASPGAETSAEPPPSPRPRTRRAERAAVRPTIAPVEAVPFEAGETRGAQALRAAAWLGVAALALAASRSALWLPAAQIGTAASGAPVELAGLELEDVSGGWIENAVGGSVLVVRARLRNPGPEPRLPSGAVRVRLVDAAGAPLADVALAGRAPQDEARLRGAAPESLAADQEAAAHALAQTPIPPGEALEVAALFPATPVEAHGFRFELGAAPALSSEASPPPPPPSSE
jgi:predicted Zn finger-like uncharacterized protein